jgi:uncharacterized protein (TIGR03083 family)
MTANPSEHFTPQALITQMDTAYTTFLNACEALTPAQAMADGLCGEWSAKQLLDHLTGWQVESPSILKRIQTQPEAAFDFDIDSFNQKTVEARKTLSWQESLTAFKDSYQAFLQALQNLSKERFLSHPNYAGWVKAMIHEYDVHLAHMMTAKNL